MRFRIAHCTTYRYEEPVKYTAQALRLSPRREGSQRTLSWIIHAPGRRTEQVDAHGNVTHLLILEAPHREIAIDVRGIVEILAAEDVIRHEGTLSPLTYLAPTPLTAQNEEIAALASAHLDRGGKLRQRLYDLAEGVYDRVRYRPGTTSVEDSAATALARGEGVCQDQAHVFIACCRAAGIPARYVSGYLCGSAAGDADGSGDDSGSRDGRGDGAGADDAGARGTASHAWVDVWLPDRKGWHAIDVTHLSPATAGHCRLAVGRDYLDAAPVRGVRRGGGREALDVRVTATRHPGQ